MSNSNKILTIGIVGLGNQGKKHLNSILSLQKAKKVRLVGICDISTNVQDNYTSPFFLDYRDLYSKARPDIVLIATPNYLHKQMTLDALHMGIHVIKEKPLATNYSDAYKMVKVSKNMHRLILTTQQRFFSPLFLKARKIIPSLGKIRSFSYRFTLNDRVKSWRWDLGKAGGGSWLNMGWHAVSMIRWLIGDISTIELNWNVNGRRNWTYKTDHSSFARITVEENIVGTIFLSCVYPKKEETIKIVFSDGILYLSRNNLKIFKKNGKKQVYRHITEERNIYTVQLKELLEKIQNNNSDLMNNLRVMTTIQAGINSIHSNSSPYASI